MLQLLVGVVRLFRYSKKYMKLYYVIFFALFSINNSYTLGLADFVPGFLVPSDISESSGADETLPVKPLVEAKRNSSQTNSWYCTRSQSNNVFCNKNTNLAVAHVLTYESNPNADNNKVVDNSVSGTKLNLGTNSNQNTLQDQQLKDALEKNQNNFSVPIQPSNDVKMKINAQQVQFNIQY